MPPKTAEQRGPGTPIGMMVGTAQAEGAAGPHTALAPPTLIEGQLPGTVDCHNCGFTSMPRAPRPSKCMACNIEICGTCLMNNGVLGRTPLACTRCGELARMAGTQMKAPCAVCARMVEVRFLKSCAEYECCVCDACMEREPVGLADVPVPMEQREFWCSTCAGHQKLREKNRRIRYTDIDTGREWSTNAQGGDPRWRDDESSDGEGLPWSVVRAANKEARATHIDMQAEADEAAGFHMRRSEYAANFVQLRGLAANLPPGRTIGTKMCGICRAPTHWMQMVRCEQVQCGKQICRHCAAWGMPADELEDDPVFACKECRREMDEEMETHLRMLSITISADVE